MSFESKLRKLRENKNLTQEELAKLVGVSLKTISRYEMGESKPRYRKIYDKYIAKNKNKKYNPHKD